MSEVERIGDRHLRSADGLNEQESATPLLIHIVVAETWANSVSGQLLVSCLVNLLCRQFGLIRRIELFCPTVPSKVWLPITARRFPEALIALARWAVADGMQITEGAGAEKPDIVVMIGDKLPCHTTGGETLLAIGDGWRAWVGEASQGPPAVTPVSANPLGPFLAATLAAGEVFKRSRGIRRGRFLTADAYSLWSGERSTSWEQLCEGPALAGHVLPPLHMIGAGAVGNDFAYIVASASLGDAYLVTIDDDRYDSTNLNRCLLAGWNDRNDEKVLAVERALRSARVGVFSFSGTLREYLLADRSGLRPDVAAAVDQLKFDIVLSCVDKGTSRQDVQGLWPNLLLGASTLNLTARTNIYNRRAGAACLGCHNPPERDGERLRLLEAQLRKMTAFELDEFCSKNGLNSKDIKEYLAAAKCGGLGEASLKDFATKPPTEFSVGFVSMGAALLLASRLFREVLFSAQAPTRDDMTTLSYLNGGLTDANLSVDENCEKRCQGRQDKSPIASPRKSR
jgi:hypothetical protein